MRLRVTLAAVLVAAAFSLPAIARDPARGAEIAAERCAACHGIDGRSSLAEIPRLAGQQSGFITLQMILFREGIRQVPAMQSPTEKLSDTDIEAVAAHYAGLPSAAPEDRTPRDAALMARGQAISAARNCGVCHLPNYAGRAQMPRLTHQHEGFLAHTMAEYRDGQRIGIDTQMNGAVQGLSNADIAALAHYLAHQD
ncbi:MAG: cytochrome c4 [Roseomonas sp.]|nr:cytochrome c4 [Roseomonas sp.]